MICIYKILLPGNRFYIGSAIDMDGRKYRHLNDLKTGKHHNSHMQRIYNKYGASVFEFTVVEECTMDNLYIREEYHILTSDRKLMVNQLLGACGGDTLSLNPRKAEIIALRSASLKRTMGNMTQEERNEVYGRKGEQNGSFGKKATDAKIEKCKLKGKIGADIRADFTRGKTAVELYGIEKAEEIKKKVSSAARVTQAGEKNNFYGKKHTEEAKRAMAKRQVGKINIKQSRPIMIDGIPYVSLKRAMAATGIPIATIAFRVRSKHFQDYHRIEDQALVSSLLGLTIPVESSPFING